MIYSQKDHKPVVIPANIRITRCPARRCAGSVTFPLRGGMMGGNGGVGGQTVTGGNGMGVVPAAFRETK